MPRVAPKPAPKPQLLGARRKASGGIPVVACLFCICRVHCACVSSLSCLLPGSAKRWAKLQPAPDEVEDLEDQPSVISGRKAWARRVARTKNVRARSSKSESLAAARAPAKKPAAEVNAKAKATAKLEDTAKPPPKVRARRRREPKKVRDKKAGRTTKKPAAVQDVDIDDDVWAWAGLFGDSGDERADDLADAVSSAAEEPLDVDALLGDMEDVIFNEFMNSQESDGTCNSPMIEVVKQLIANLPTATHTNLLHVWRILATHSSQRKLKTGSGCSGSGLDWHVIQSLSEVLYACVVCMLLVMSS